LATVDPTGAVAYGVLDINCPLFSRIAGDLCNVKDYEDSEMLNLTDDFGYTVTARYQLDIVTDGLNPASGLALIGSRRDRLNFGV
jgi:hypothetical protein